MFEYFKRLLGQNTEKKEKPLNLYQYKFIRFKEERDKAKFILRQVIDYYCKNPKDMPKLYQDIVEEEGLKRGVADYIAGMTDDYCIATFNKIYVPKFVIY